MDRSNDLVLLSPPPDPTRQTPLDSVPLTISDLPHELISLVLELSIDSRYQATADVRYTANQTLRYASRVCRAWRAPAQQLLWRDVELPTLRRAQMFCQNQLTPMPITRVLTLGEEEDIEDEGMCWEKAGVIETVLSACRGIHEVRLRNLYLPFAAELFSAKLSAVTSLDLVCMNLPEPPNGSSPINDITPLLHLQHLGLDCSWPIPRHLPSVVLQPTLTSLRLVLLREAEVSDLLYARAIRNNLLPVLPAVFPYLTSFSATIPPDLEPLLHPLYALLTQLEHMECLPTDLELVSSTLTTWTTAVPATWNDEGSLVGVLEALRSRSALRKLEKLVLSVSLWEGEDEEDLKEGWDARLGADELELECAARKILVVLRSETSAVEFELHSGQ